MTIIESYRCDICGSIIQDKKEYNLHLKYHKKKELKKSLFSEGISKVFQATSLEEIRDSIYTGFNSFARNKLESLNIAFTHTTYPYSSETKTKNGAFIKPKRCYRLSIVFEYKKTLNRFKDDNFRNYLNSCGFLPINGHSSNEKIFHYEMYMIIENFPNLHSIINNTMLKNEDLLISKKNKLSTVASNIRQMESYAKICEKIDSINESIKFLQNMKEEALVVLRNSVSEKVNSEMSEFDNTSSEIKQSVEKLQLNLKQKTPSINVDCLGVLRID